MRGMKCCPKCGSTNTNFTVFYRPSIWKCMNCGYEGAFIVEGSMLGERLQECHRRRCNVTDWTVSEARMRSWDGSTDDWQKTLGDRG